MRPPQIGSVLLRAYLIATLVLMVAPLIFVVVDSFNPSGLRGTPQSGLSLRWYVNALVNYPQFRESFRTSLVVASAATVIATVAGTLAAVALVRYDFRGRELLRSVFVAPMVFPRVAIGLGSYIMFLRLFELLHLRDALLGTPISLIVVHSLLGLPVVFLVVSSALAGVDISLEEAAMDLGANRLVTLRFVTLPLISHAIASAAAFAFMFSFDEVETSFFLAPVGGQTLPVAMFLFMDYDSTPTVAALSTLLLLLTIIVLGVVALFSGRERLLRAIARTA